MTAANETSNERDGITFEDVLAVGLALLGAVLIASLIHLNLSTPAEPEPVSDTWIFDDYEPTEGGDS